MYNFKKCVAVLLIYAITLSFFIPTAFATESNVEIAIADITFDKYVNKNGEENSDIGTVTVEFSKIELEGQLTLLLSTEEITDTTSASLAKIIYINQVDIPEYNIISFPIEKARIAAAIGSENIDGCNLFLKVNGTGGSDATTVETKFTDPYKDPFDINGDGKLTVLDALITINLSITKSYNEVVDVNEDGKITLLDVLRMLKLCSNA